jgi:phosphoglycerate dehydrogenase-like enzyme
MSDARVAVLDDDEGVLGASPGVQSLRELADVTVFDHHLDDDALVDAITGHQCVIALRERTRFHADLLHRLPDLELIAQSGTHAYHVDIDAASAAGVVVALGVAPDSEVTPMPSVMPELVFGLLFSLTRQIPQVGAELAADRWPKALGRTLRGQRLGILGLGKHGRAVAGVAQAFGMEVLAWGPTLDDERAAAAGVRRLPLEDLLAEVDVVSIHLKLSELSRGLLGPDELDLLRPSAILVNTARGAIVDEDALVERLRDGRLAGAALDVFAEEPLPAGSSLRTLPNVVATPHVGWTVDTIIANFAAITSDHVDRYLRGRLTREQVSNPEALEVNRQRVGGVA